MQVGKINQKDNLIFITVSQGDEDEIKRVYLSSKITGKRSYWKDPIRIYPTNIIKTVDDFELCFNVSNFSLETSQLFQIRGVKNLVVREDEEQLFSSNPIVIKARKIITNSKKGVLEYKNNSFFYSGSSKLVALKRTDQHKMHAHYPKQYELSVGSNGVVDFNVKNMVNVLQIIDRDIIDIFEVNNLKEKNPLSLDGTLKDEFLDNDNVKYIVYKTSSKNVALRFASKERIYVQKFEEAKGDLILTLNKRFNPKKLGISEISTNYIDTSIQLLNESDYSTENNKLIFKSFFENAKNISKNRLKFSFVIRYSIEQDEVIGTLKINLPSESKIRIEELVLGTRSSIFNDIILEIHSYKRQNVARIGVLGSSQTRRIFTSSSYFNPEYKNYFISPFTQHHSSIRALVSEKPIEFDENFFIGSDIVPLRPSIRRDMEKTFFEELENADVDFLLIDLYSDIQMGVFEFSDGRMVTYSMSQVESDYIAENITSDVHISSMKTDPEYRDKFQKALKIFRKKILNVIDEKNIILHIFDLNYEYVGKDGGVHKYKTPSADEIAQTNHFAVELQADLVSTFPNAGILDSRGWKWIGDESMPSGNMPHHYQSERYSFLLNELAKLIVQRNKI